ncbi:hypothetical protein CVT25_012799 [Psilocybe cyanescens]|uniref:Uncharacterized protein n=1 Tax=Psilocybe cyanescens TaxID=93625 RepID=A0A409XLI8_PSICY|nr:hypothetical protein CVT25_012799 [Psilocybe cyanescens]
MALIRYSLIFAAALQGLHLAKGQTSHTVMVGLQGSFFDPPTISAGLNDTITFVFAGFVHTVTQSSLANPCTPLPGGFSSGPAGTLNNDTQHPMTWDLQITNVSQRASLQNSPANSYYSDLAIWFFCEVTEPTSHCATSGMVGPMNHPYTSVINPPSIDAYTRFRASAQQVTGTPEPSFVPVLTGVGAFATGTPAIPTTSVSIPPLSDTTSSSSIPLPTSTSSDSSATPSSAAAGASHPSTSHLGAIVGGAVGGAAVLALGIVGILWFCRVQKSRSIPPSPASDDANFFRYNPVPVRRPSEAFIEAKQLESVKSATQVTPPRTLSPDTPMSPNRRGQVPQFPPGVPRVAEPTLDRQASFGSNAMSLSAGASEHPPNINIHALATEVAGILRAPSNASMAQHNLSPHPEGGRSMRKLASDNSRNGADSINRTESPLGPPAYRTAVAPHPDSRPST